LPEAVPGAIEFAEDAYTEQAIPVITITTEKPPPDYLCPEEDRELLRGQLVSYMNSYQGVVPGSAFVMVTDTAWVSATHSTSIRP
jgi:hypothetical protein